jgi:transposase
MKQAGLPVELLETRHVRTAFKIMPVKTDRKDPSSGIPSAAPTEP